MPRRRHPRGSTMPSPDAATGEASTRLSTDLRAFRFHPNVVRNFFDHHIRVSSKDVPRMLGCVIGMKSGRTVEILDSLDLVLDPVSGTLCRALLEKKEHYKKVLPGSVVVGWYSSPTGSPVQDTDMQIYKALMDAEGRAFYIVLKPAIKLSQMDLHVTIYDCVLDATDGSPQFNLVKFDCTIEILEAERISSNPATGFKRCFLCPNRAVSDVNLLPLEKKEGARPKHRAFRTMLLETPSGFAMFSVSARFLTHPEEIWKSFTCLSDAHDAISTLGFIKVDNKSVARNSNVGPGKDLENFILKFTTTHALIVPDAQLKFVIEHNLKVICWLDARIVHELTWGLKYVLDEFVPEEKGNQCHLPLSKELEKKIKSYGFSVSPGMIDREFITTLGYLYKLELTSESLSVFLHHKFDDCFYGSCMSDLDFAKAVADRLQFCEEIIPNYGEYTNYGEYSKQDIVRFTEFLLAAPRLKNDAISHLKRMVAAANEHTLAVPDKEKSCLDRMVAVASEDRLAVPEQKKSMEFSRKAEARGKESKLLVNIEAAASRPKALGKKNKGDDSDDSDLSENASDEKEEEERPKKPENRKRGSAGSALKMPASNKKAKVAIPSGQKKGDSKGAVHVATLHPAKKTGQTPATHEKSPRSSHMEVLQQDMQAVIIDRIFRKKRRCVTLVKGLELFGVKLSDASKKLKKKFATQASVFKGPTEKEQIVVQGDVSCDIVEFIRDTWPEVPESAIYLLGQTIDSSQHIPDDGRKFATP